MDIRDLACFLQVAEAGGVTRAAEALFLTQSSLSKRIARLERELGAPLFDRAHRAMRLTAAGEAVREAAPAVLAAHADLLRLLRERAGALRLGVLPVLDSYGFAGALARFTREHPVPRLDVVEMENAGIGAALRGGTLDAAIFRPEGEAPDLFAQVLRRDELALLVPQTHPLAGRASVSLRELRGEPFILLGRGTQLYEASLDACRAAGFEPQVVYTGSSSANFARLVREGAGVALLLHTVARGLARDGLRAVRLTRRVPGDLYFACPKRRAGDPALRALCDCLRTET